jgi:hypothetical protein
MHIGNEVHNYMEKIVGQLMIENELQQKYDADKLQDIACIALSQLRPIYIRFDVDFIAALPSAKREQYLNQAQIALHAAERLIVEDRRKHREDDFPVIQSDQNRLYDEDAELEWYETPIVK